MSAYTLHLLARDPGLAAELIAAERQAGTEVRCVLLHDQVWWATATATGAGAAPPCDRLYVGADDCRRRGLAVPDAGVEYPEIVDLIADAARVVCW